MMYTNIIRSILLLSISFSTAFCAKPNKPTTKPDNDRVYFSSPLLAFADGRPFGITADYIGFILQILRELSKMEDGEKDSAGAIRGLFKLNDKKYTLKELVELEQECDLLWQQLHKPNTTLSPAARKASQDLYNSKKAALNSCLQQAKNYFITKVLPFAEYGRGVQKLTMELIAESCAYYNRNNSFLLTWGECPEGREAEIFNKSILTVKDLHEFAVDLTNFLKNMVYSCPKARAEFLARVKK